MVALVETIGGPVHLVGHDWGANSAGWSPHTVPTWSAAGPRRRCRTPRRSGARCSAAASSSRSGTWVPSRHPALPERLAARPGGRFDKGLRNGGMTAADVERFRAEIVEYGALTGGLNWYRAMPYTDQSGHRRSCGRADDAGVERR